MSYKETDDQNSKEATQKIDPQEFRERSRAQEQARAKAVDSFYKDDDIELDDFITYDDYYDLPQGSRHSRNRYDDEDDYDYDDYGYDDYEEKYRYGASKGRRIIGKIILYLQAAVSILFFVLLWRLNVLPDRYLYIVGGGLAVIWLIIFFTQRKRRNIGQAVGMVFSILFSIVLAAGSFYLQKTDQVIETVTSGRTYDIRTYDVVVRADDTAQTLTDARNYTFAVQGTIDQEKLDSLLSDIQNDIGGEISTVVITSAIGEAEALLNGEVDAIIYNDAFTSTIVEQYPEYEYQVRVLENYTVKTESAVQTVEENENNDWFLMLISGTDSEGEVSLTGRSDVDIVAGINTSTKEVLLLTIPRDYYVEFPGITSEGSRDKLTHAGIYGMDELLKTVDNLLGCSINYYVRVNFSSMIQIVDAMGGIDIYNEQEFTSHGGYFYPQGDIHMDGEYTLHYVRERYAFEDGDFARGRHQIQVIQAMLDKLMSVNTFANYSALADAISNFAATNIPSSKVTEIIKTQVSENPSWHIVTYQLLGEVMMQPCQSANGSYLSVDMPYVEAVNNAMTLLGQLENGEVISEDLQLVDNGQLTYITTPVS